MSAFSFAITVISRFPKLLYPPDTTVDGKTYRFNGTDNAEEILRTLSEKIREITERMTKANGG